MERIYIKPLTVVAIVAVKVLIVAMLAFAAIESPVHAAQFGNFHRVVFDPYGAPSIKIDELRVKIGEHYTYCDFETYNRYDARLIGRASGGERGSLMSCIPGRILYLEGGATR